MGKFLNNLVIPGQHDILEATSKINFDSILDVGIGKGGAAYFFAKQGKKVSAIGVDISAYEPNIDELKQLDVKIAESFAERMPYPDQSFDAVWMAHMLEHSMHPTTVLSEAFRILKPNGWLFISVPPYKSSIVSGHIFSGWNLGQLMFTLLINGFNVKNGHFVRHGYNLTAFVQKNSDFNLKQHPNFHEIESLNDYWPKPLKSGFEGNVVSINWIGFTTNHLLRELGHINYLKHKMRLKLLKKTI